MKSALVVWALIFLDRGSGDDETDDATAHESFELSELNDTSMTPFGLPGTTTTPNLRFLDWPTFADANSEMSLQQSSALSCFRNHFWNQQKIGKKIETWRLKLTTI